MSVVRTPVDAHCDWSKKPPSIRVIEINRVRRYTRTDVKKKKCKNNWISCENARAAVIVLARKRTTR